ncbi:hypothetical protein [Mailhella massiliensis]|uniref:hypothetical protein n=1 Tax=Mailhella massiliensis TaxID=1903261 RepID=UPI0023561A28|nr:hypothetical protein [Mailhella massiliensis]
MFEKSPAGSRTPEQKTDERLKRCLERGAAHAAERRKKPAPQRLRRIRALPPGKIFGKRELLLSFARGIKYKKQERNASMGCLSAQNKAEGSFIFNLPEIFHRRALS